MRRDILVYISIVVLILILFSIPIFSQESQGPVTKPPEVQDPAKEEASQPEELSIYGEVQSVNSSSNSITVQYYDYDSDEEKSIEIVSDKDTKIENVATLNDIKQNDWVDITYSVSDGKNLAKTINVEKEAEFPIETTPEEVTEELEKE